MLKHAYFGSPVCIFLAFPNPGAEHVDTCTVSWQDDFKYCFPPFSLLGWVIEKLAMDKSDAILILPQWPTQAWFSATIGMLIHLPILLPRTPDWLTLPHASHLCHPLYPNMELMACRVSSRPSRVRAFLLGQPQLSCHPWEELPKHNIPHTLRDSKCFAKNGRLIQPIRLWVISLISSVTYLILDWVIVHWTQLDQPYLLLLWFKEVWQDQIQWLLDLWRGYKGIHSLDIIIPQMLA